MAETLHKFTHWRKVRTSWDADRYATMVTPKQSGQNMKTEERLLSVYRADHPGMYLNQPAVIADVHGAILSWYLPKSLSPTRQVTKICIVLS